MLYNIKYPIASGGLCPPDPLLQRPTVQLPPLPVGPRYVRLCHIGRQRRNGRGSDTEMDVENVLLRGKELSHEEIVGL